MDNGYAVKLTPQAQEHLREIANYIAYTLQEPETAKRNVEILEKAILSLSDFPARVPLTPEEPWRTQGIHKLLVKNYLVYFWIDEHRKTVEIIGIIYARRDQRHQLSQLNIN